MIPGLGHREGATDYQPNELGTGGITVKLSLHRKFITSRKIL
jgi:hypothetical protein